MSLNSGTRLNKYISDSGYCSRREADKLIESKRVRINGNLPEVGTKVGSEDEVTVDGMVVYSSAANKSDRVYIVYNKPVGITCTTESNVKGNIVDAVDHDQRVFPIGRLDKPSEGLILLTSDGDIVNKILRAENAHDKEYLVSVDKPLASDFADKMSSGIPILGTVTKPCKVTPAGRNAFKIILTEGLNRQIRRMCEYLGYEVQTLKRLRIMNIELGKLRPGQWRNLTKGEMADLNDAISESSSEAQAPTKKARPSHAKKTRSQRPDSRSSAARKSSDRNEKNPRGGERGAKRHAQSGKRDERSQSKAKSNARGTSKNQTNTRGPKKSTSARPGKRPPGRSGKPKR